MRSAAAATWFLHSSATSPAGPTSTVRVYWTLLNMGAGNLSLIRERRARDRRNDRGTGPERSTSPAARSAASLADAQAAHNQIGVARQELASAELGFKEDLERSRQNLGRPIEVLNSLTLLAQARVNLIRHWCITTRPSSRSGSRSARRLRSKPLTCPCTRPLAHWEAERHTPPSGLSG